MEEGVLQVRKVFGSVFSHKKAGEKDAPQYYTIMENMVNMSSLFPPRYTVNNTQRTKQIPFAPSTFFIINFIWYNTTQHRNTQRFLCPEWMQNL